MPPIAGVAQGAMVLRDASLANLNARDVLDVLKPKVDGSLHLDELFPENNLDFFIFLSSLAYSAGNRGQASYGAANAFMASLVANRRSRGLAGSVVHIGAILGEGSVSRALTRQHRSALYRSGFSHLSEDTFHEIFAEGVRASRPESNESPELSAGLRLADIEGDQKTWASNPIFSHLVPRKTVEKIRDVESELPVDMEKQIHDANSPGKLLEVLESKWFQDRSALLHRLTFSVGFCNTLRSILHTDVGIRQLMRSSPYELGIDSLIAVDIQSWFRKVVGIEVPVLEVLNAETLRHLLSLVTSKMPSTTETVPIPGRPSDCSDEYFISDGSGSLVASDMKSFQDDTIQTVSTPDLTEFSDTDCGSKPGDDRSDTGLGITAEFQHLSNQPLLARAIPMSFAQSRFWFLNFLVEDQSAFTVTTSIQLRGYVDSIKLNQALQTVGERHEALRTIFYTDEFTNKHMQGVLGSSTLRLDHSFITEEGQADENILEMTRHKFDLAHGESLRLKLLSMSAQKHRLIVSYHHIVMDSIGLQVFLSELEQAYQGTPSLYQENTLQYPDFTLRQLRNCQNGSWDKQLSFWRDQYAELPPPLPMLLFSRRSSQPPTLTFRSWCTKFRLPKSLKDQIAQRCVGLAVNPFHIHLTVFAILLYSYTNNAMKDLCIGVADSGRQDFDTLRSLGLYLNLLPVRFRADENDDFITALGAIKTSSEMALGNSNVPFDVILNALDVPRDTSRTPLFQALFNYRPRIEDSRSFLGCNADGMLVSGGENAYDVSVDITDSNTGEVIVVLSVNSGLYTVRDATLLQNTYVKFLQEFVQDPTLKIARPPFMDEDIQKAIIQGRG